MTSLIGKHVATGQGYDFPGLHGVVTDGPSYNHDEDELWFVRFEANSRGVSGGWVRFVDLILVRGTKSDRVR